MAPADLVLTDVDVFTGNPAAPWASGLAITDGRITAVCSDDAELREQVGTGTEVLSLPGRLVTAGFQDSHIHAPFAGRFRINVSLHDLDTVEGYLDHIAAYAQANPDKEWIYGSGWAMSLFPGGTPSKELLDRVVPDRPVFLLNRDVHSAWVNSAALERGHITRETADPWDGRIERDPATGEPMGTLHEGAAYTFANDFIPEPDRDEWERSILNAQEYLHSLGITGWQDAWVTPFTEEAYRSLAADGRLTARVVGALWWERQRGLDQVADLQGRRERGSVGTFHPTSVKIMTDGVVENFTAALIKPYCDAHGHETDNVGYAYLDHDELAAAVTALDQVGFQVHMHALGDRAVKNALDAVEAAIAANGRRDARHHLAHLQLVDRADLPRFAALGAVANCQPYWAQTDAQMEELTLPFLGPERSSYQYAFGDLLASGARLAFGSDWSVSTPNPLVELEVAVNRVDPSVREAAPFLPEQRLSLVDALTAFTSGTAYVNFDDADAGTLEVGKRADLAVLDQNVLAPGANPIADASVEWTFVSGRPVHAPR
jgi:predicted amidohydrolase YtcJ